METGLARRQYTKVSIGSIASIIGWRVFCLTLLRYATKGNEVMSKVRWVNATDLCDNDEAYVLRTPIVPLADLTKVVEGLRFIALSKDEDVVVIPQRLLTQLEFTPVKKGDGDE